MTAELLSVTPTSILNALPHAVLALNAQDTIVSANDAAQAFFGASLSHLSKRPIAAFVPFGSPLLTLPSKVRQEQAGMVEYRVDLSSPRLGQGQIVDIHAMPLPEDPQVVILTLDRHSMAEKIDRALTSRSAARSVTGLAAMLAHEIRNPLSGIRGAAQLIEPTLGEEDRPLARLITDETDRIVKLVDRMEVFGDARPVRRAPVNIHDVLDHVERLARSGFARGIEIKNSYDPSLPPVHANRDQLVQVFLNLVKNAAEAVEANGGGTITLTTAFRPGMRVAAPGSPHKVSLPLEFCVKDDGPGVPDDLVPHLFEPFVTTKTNGTGLGLALVAKIVGDHGGVIEIDSGAGTTVRVLMPAYQGNPEGDPDQ
ncbi:two-component system sensor histidine kinase NtrB [Acuticoccus mangrovi]|uniref:histidine kinase n=1 Tax=Acuticoccus mangrovi TaxID=2796142 RepID=A0A934IM55_9HYPH|nr:ATP-binding protein [Acuticoccus mangrovi]MBJ3774450.1 PAS domain-containing protein [Acuticoccus mangrovi]